MLGASLFSILMLFYFLLFFFFFIAHFLPILMLNSNSHCKQSSSQRLFTTVIYLISLFFSLVIFHDIVFAKCQITFLSEVNWYVWNQEFVLDSFLTWISSASFSDQQHSPISLSTLSSLLLSLIKDVSCNCLFKKNISDLQCTQYIFISTSLCG